MTKEWYTTGEVAKMLGVSSFTVWWWIQKGEIPAWRVGRGHYRIPASVVEKLLKEKEQCGG